MDEKLTERLMAVIEVEVDDQKFEFHMPYGFSFGAAYDAAHEVMSTLVKRSKEFTEKIERNKEEEAGAKKK